MLQQIVAKTDGVPLFVEELTKMVLESGLLQEREEHYELTGPLPPLAIPTTLHDSLMARLDHLATVKGLAQLGATLGREFSYALLRAVSPWDEDTLHRWLQQLVAAEFLYQQGLPPHATYRFKHALIQDTAYQSLLRSTRQQGHQRIAQVLEARFPETRETQPELLAYHYTEAGLKEQALGYWQRAGQRAIERSAHLEAVTHLTKGLEVLKTLPDASQRTQQELELQIALGAPLMAIKGYAAPEVEHTYTRARELCQQVGETPRLFSALRGLWVVYLIGGELQAAHKLGEQLLTLAQQVQDPAFFLEAHLVLGSTLLCLGEFASARGHLEQGVAFYDRHQHHSLAFLYGFDPGVHCLRYLAMVLWFLGYADQALTKTHQALALAQELSHPFSLAAALAVAAWLHQFRREWHLTHERAEALIALATEQGFALWVAGGTTMRGWALTERYAASGAGQGPGEESIAQIQRGLAGWSATGAKVFRPYGLALLAEAYAQVGQYEAGLARLAEGLAVVDETGERRWEVELCRLKGELLLACSAEHATEAETCFLQALDIARHQQARSLELRAAVSLSRLWQQQGKRDEARELLVPIYDWFTEGFDTVDLQEAKALLEELS